MNDDATVTPLTRCDECRYLFVDIEKHVRESVTVPPLVDHLDRFMPMGFIWDGRCFEFTDHGTVEVEGWSGDLGNGLTYDIRAGEPDDDES